MVQCLCYDVVDMIFIDCTGCGIDSARGYNMLAKDYLAQNLGSFLYSLIVEEYRIEFELHVAECDEMGYAINVMVFTEINNDDTYEGYEDEFPSPFCRVPEQSFPYLGR